MVSVSGEKCWGVMCLKYTVGACSCLRSVVVDRRSAAEGDRRKQILVIGQS
jgi:hypothetical protein